MTDQLQIPDRIVRREIPSRVPTLADGTVVVHAQGWKAADSRRQRQRKPRRITSSIWTRHLGRRRTSSKSNPIPLGSVEDWRRGKDAELKAEKDRIFGSAALRIIRDCKATRWEVQTKGKAITAGRRPFTEMKGKGGMSTLQKLLDEGWFEQSIARAHEVYANEGVRPTASLMARTADLPWNTWSKRQPFSSMRHGV